MCARTVASFPAFHVIKPGNKATHTLLKLGSLGYLYIYLWEVVELVSLQVNIVLREGEELELPDFDDIYTSDVVSMKIIFG